MSRSLHAVLLSMSLFAGAACDEAAGGPEPTDAGAEPDASLQEDAGPEACVRGVEPLASDVTLREVALYQTVKVPLARDGVAVAQRESPVVQGKDALVRVFVEPAEAREGRKLRAVLTLDNEGTAMTLVAEHPVLSASTDAELDSTFNFDVPAAALGAATRLSVELVDPECTDVGGKPAQARFPGTGTEALGATAIGALRVELVPFELAGKAPDLSAERLEAMRAELLARFPVPAVELTVHAKVSSAVAVEASGGGWSALLSEVIALRAADAPANDVYYYGVYEPGKPLTEYCAFGCVLGLTPAPSVTGDAAQRAALGTVFVADELIDLFSHDLGRLHGRSDVGCPGSFNLEVDAEYPGQDGATEVWGWDPRSRALLPPTAKDMLTFGCQDVDPLVIGVSEYTYAAIAERSAAVNRP